MDRIFNCLSNDTPRDYGHTIFDPLHFSILLILSKSGLPRFFQGGYSLAI